MHKLSFIAHSIRLARHQEIFAEFARRGLMFLDEQLAVALSLPAVKAR